MSAEATLDEHATDDSPPDENAAAPVANAPRDKSFLTHAAIYGVGAILLQAASVVLVPLYTRYLTPAEFGVLEMVGRIGEVFSICLLANGIRLAAFTFYCQAKGDLERRRTAATVLWAPLVIVFGAGLLAAAVAPFLDAISGIGDPALVVFGIVMIMLEGTTVVPLALIQARVESAYYVAVMTAMFCLRVSLTIVAVAGLGWGVWGVLGAAAVNFGVFGVLLSWREFRINSFRPDFAKMKEVMKFSLPFVPAGFCGMLLHNGDRFFLMRFAGADEVGQYALGYKLAVTVGMLATAPILQVWTARMYDAFDRPDAALYVGRVCSRIMAAYLFASIGLCVFDVDLLAVLAVPAYGKATAVVIPIVLAYFFWTWANLMDAPLWVRRRSDLKPWILLASSFATVCLYLVAIPRWGALGAAYATLAGLTLHCAITFFVSQRVVRVRYEFGRLAIMLAAAMFVVFAAHHTRPDLIGLVHKLFIWLTWPVMLWLGGVVSAEEKAMLAAGLLRIRSWFEARRFRAEQG